MLRRVRLHAIQNEFRTEIFRGRNILRSKSREIAPKSVPLGDAQPRRDPQRSPTTVQSIGTRGGARLKAIFFFRPQSERIIHNRGRGTPYIYFALNHRSGEGMQAYDYNNQPKCTQATPEDKQQQHAHTGTPCTQARREPNRAPLPPSAYPHSTRASSGAQPPQLCLRVTHAKGDARTLGQTHTGSHR